MGIIGYVIAFFILLFIIGYIKSQSNLNSGNKGVKLQGSLDEILALDIIKEVYNHEDCPFFGKYDLEDNGKYVDEFIEFNIAGVNMHNNQAGAFVGMTLSEPNNKYDPNAIAILDIKNDEKTIGYIQKKKLERFNKISSIKNDRKINFIFGYIYHFDSDDGELLNGKIFVPKNINPAENIEDVKEFEKYLIDFSQALN